jgi:hypothetical protein
MIDLRTTRVLVVVWAMPGCGACDEYTPVFLKRINAFKKAGAPFHVWQPGDVLAPGQIPVMFYDASAENEELQAFADQLKVTGTPTTCVLTHGSVSKVEGSVPAEKIDKLLQSAISSNR